MSKKLYHILIILSFILISVSFAFSSDTDGSGNEESYKLIYKNMSTPSWTKYVDKSIYTNTEELGSTKLRHFYVVAKTHHLHNSIILCNFRAKRTIAEHIQTKVLTEAKKAFQNNESAYKSTFAKAVDIAINTHSSMEMYIEKREKSVLERIYIVHMKVSISEDKLKELSAKLLKTMVK